MKIEQEKLRQELLTLLESHQAQAEKLAQIPLERLNAKPSAEAWSVLECIEHLNRYGDFYIPELEKRIAKSPRQSRGHFRSSWLGEYFAQSMWPKDKLNRMKTFRSMDPKDSDLNKEVIERFIDQLRSWQNLLDKAQAVDWRRTKTSISISKWIQLHLGDTLRVVFYHNERHLRQAFRALAD